MLFIFGMAIFCLVHDMLLNLMALMASNMAMWGWVDRVGICVYVVGS